MALFRWLRRLARRMFWPYHCRECGRPYRRFRPDDAPAEYRQRLLRSGELHTVLAHGYRCDDCHPAGKGVLIF